MKLNNYINHIVFTIDGSTSMQGLTNQVVTVFDNQIKYLAAKSQAEDQETRVSVYIFGNDVQCLVYDKDVLRLPSLVSFYVANGMTALIDGVYTSVTELQQTAQLHGDHSFVVYGITDGEENRSSRSSSELSKLLDKLPDNWSVCMLVPNQRGVALCERFGFPRSAIEVWDVSERGIQEVGRKMERSLDTFFAARKTGVRGTKNLFSLDASALTKTQVVKQLEELSPASFETLIVRKKSVIKDFVESWMKTPYRVGSAYYQLVKKEKIQPSKHICIREKATGKVYSGDKARQLLGLPNYEVKVAPEDHGKFDLFCQSSSNNRILPENTHLLVMK